MSNVRVCLLGFLVMMLSVSVILMNVPLVHAVPNVRVSFTVNGTTRLVDATKGVGTTFTVDIKADNVFDMYGWGFNVRWAGLVLDFTSITEGTLLNRGDSTRYPTMFVPKWFNEESPDSVGDANYCTVGNTLLGLPAGDAVDGSGILATITFTVEKANSESALDLYLTKVLDYFNLDMTHTDQDGYFANINWASRGYPGDVDGDHDVDMAGDVTIIARAMGTNSGMPQGTGWGLWNSAADISGPTGAADSKVDIFDLMKVCVNYGEPR